MAGLIVVSFPWLQVHLCVSPRGGQSVVQSRSSQADHLHHCRRLYHCVYPKLLPVSSQRPEGVLQFGDQRDAQHYGILDREERLRAGEPSVSADHVLDLWRHHQNRAVHPSDDPQHADHHDDAPGQYPAATLTVPVQQSPQRGNVCRAQPHHHDAGDGGSLLRGDRVPAGHPGGDQRA